MSLTETWGHAQCLQHDACFEALYQKNVDFLKEGYHFGGPYTKDYGILALFRVPLFNGKLPNSCNTRRIPTPPALRWQSCPAGAVAPLTAKPLVNAKDCIAIRV